MAYCVTRRIGKYLYRYEVESYWDRTKGQSRQRILRFLGRVNKEGHVILRPTVRLDSISGSLPVGALALFYAVARELDMVSHIKEVLDIGHEAAAHVLCLVLNQIGPRRSLTNLPAWVVRSPDPSLGTSGCGAIESGLLRASHAPALPHDGGWRARGPGPKASRGNDEGLARPDA